MNDDGGVGFIMILIVFFSMIGQCSNQNEISSELTKIRKIMETKK